jgi:hypothetical protein
MYESNYPKFLPCNRYLCNLFFCALLTLELLHVIIKVCYFFVHNLKKILIIKTKKLQVSAYMKSVGAGDKIISNFGATICR